jgi:hypothetical protein
METIIQHLNSTINLLISSMHIQWRQRHQINNFHDKRSTCNNFTETNEINLTDSISYTVQKSSPGTKYKTNVKMDNSTTLVIIIRWMSEVVILSGKSLK